MAPEHEKKFADLVERGRIPADVADGLRELIDEVREKAYSDGAFAESFAIHTGPRP